jgi:TolB-like protein
MMCAAAACAQPTTAPVEATKPTGPPAILVVVFGSPADGQYRWVGEAIARDLVTSLAGATHARVDLLTTPLQDPRAVRQAAAGRKDSVAVFGSTQLAGSQVRVTGQVIDVNSGAVPGTFNAAAPANNLFPLEDQLSGQVVAALPRQWVNAPTSAPPAAGSLTSEGYASTSGPEYQSYVYPDYAAYPPGYYAPYAYYSYPRSYYDYTYAYPSWWWYEPYAWYGPIYYHGYWHHHWGGDHDWDDHFARPWGHGFAGRPTVGLRPDGSPYAPHGPHVGHIGGAGHVGGGHVGR